MNTTDHHPDPELDGLGDRLRRQAASGHAGDLGDLVHRAAAHQRRSRIIVATGCIALFAVVAGIGVVIGGRDAIDSTPAATTTEPAVNGSATTLPRWPTYSVVLNDPEIWALEVVYDPALWDYSRVYDAVRIAPGELGPSASSYRSEPKVYLYWPGARGEHEARTVETTLRGRPGIVSVQLGRGEPGASRGTGSVPMGSSPPR